MPPTLLFDLSQIDLNQVVFDRSEIEKSIPQRDAMSQLDGIIWYDADKLLCLGYKDITDHEFWVKGHIPGRPLMPGVIMIEAAAQVSSFYMNRIYGLEGFIGFAGIDYAQFRGTVEPGARLLLLSHISKVRSRQFTATVQGLVGDSMVFDTAIKGMRV